MAVVKKKVLQGELVDLVRIPVEEIEVGRTYLNWVGNLVKVLHYDEVSKLMRLYNISESAKQFIDRKNVWFVKLVK